MHLISKNISSNRESKLHVAFLDDDFSVE